MKKECGQPSSIEVTYNSVQAESGFTVFDTVKYLKDTYGIANIHIVPISIEKKSLYYLSDMHAMTFGNSVHNVFYERKKKKIDYSFSFMNRVIQSLTVKKASKYFCEAGISSFSISCKGEVYPCFMSIDIEEFKMGDVWNEDFFASQAFCSINKSLKDFNKFKHLKCKDCFNSHLCFGCIDINYFKTGDMFKTSEQDCMIYKNISETVLTELANCQ